MFHRKHFRYIEYEIFEKAIKNTECYSRYVNLLNNSGTLDHDADVYTEYLDNSTEAKKELMELFIYSCRGHW